MVVDLDALIAGRVPGMSLPRAFYTDQAVFEADLRRVFYRNWLFAGHACEIPRPGDYVLFSLGPESLILVRDKAGAIHAHFDVCRHRGSRLALEPQGNVRALICPYHQWVYALDGALTNARLMGEDFCPARYALRSAHVRELAGLIFVCLAPDPPSFDVAAEQIAPQVSPHGLEGARVIYRAHYEVRANWKVLVENNRECYHCRVNHPEFCLSNYDVGLPGDPRRDAEMDAALERAYARWQSMGLAPRLVNFPAGSPFRAARFPLKDGYVTESLDGRLVAPLMGTLSDPDAGSLRLIALPNFWGHANCDHAMTTRLSPLTPDRTAVDVSFIVRADAVEGVDYDPLRVREVWQATSEQDWTLCENNYAGILSAAYEPGPYSPIAENSVDDFVVWYLDQLAVQ